jgi:hypothetical protein
MHFVILGGLAIVCITAVVLRLLDKMKVGDKQEEE